MQWTAHQTWTGRATRALTGLALALALATPAGAAVPGADLGTAPDLSTAQDVGTAPDVGAGGGGPAARVAADTGDGAERTVGLITGDRVTVRERGGAGPEVDVQLAERDGYDATYEVREEAGQVYVLPSDVVTLVPGTLDRELFNVSKLVDSGYDVAHGLPVIVAPRGTATGRAAHLGSLAAMPGVRRWVQLSSLGAEAVTVTGGSPAFWQHGTGPATPAARAAGETLRLTGQLAAAGKVWLDERVEAALDKSVPQIGAPQAWQRGYDGSDVTVAVLDTGIDGSHPDLDGKVVGARTFVFTDTADDGHGHGTHVAGIIAGDGGGQDGTYTGVAPGAKLLNGKVLDDSGSGYSSSIIDGMEWAVEAGADVVNMSVGSNNASNGFDLLSRSADQLTADHDVLFVVAAGNLGPGAWTIASPGAASSVLTVGAVDGSDRLASFSSRGPRLVPALRHLIGGVFAIKPDITAPGSGIVSARAKGTTMGTPVNARYTRASGTSMATPHVAGAAAILLQSKPDLGAAALKSALVSSAVPNDTLTVYQQGGGRVDVPAALDSAVTATPAPLDFGSFIPPYDRTEPVGKVVTYTNNRAAPLHLDLALDVTSPESGAPDASGIRVVPAELDLAAGQSADVTVTVDPRQSSPGTYGGYLLATDDSGAVVHRVPTGYWLEPPTYTLTIKGIDRAGRPSSGPLDGVAVDDVVDLNTFSDYRSFYRSEGTITVRVPAGTYGISGRFQDPSPVYGEELSLVSRPEVEVTQDLTITLDARTANRVTVRTPEPSAPLPYSDVLVGYHRRSAAGQSSAHVYSVDPATPVYVAAAEAPRTGEVTLFTRWLQGATGHRAKPALYDLALVESGEIPADLTYTIDAADLASVENRYPSDAPDQVVRSTRFAEIPGFEGLDLGVTHDFAVPVERTDYYLAGTAAHRQRVNLNGSTSPTLFTTPVTYTAGEHRSQTWFARPMAPGLRPGKPTVRSWDMLRVNAAPWAGQGHALEGDVDYAYFQDGRPIRSGTLTRTGSQPAVLPMSGTPAEYRLELRSATDRSWWQTAPSASTAWTFGSAPPANGGPQVLPLLTLAYDLDLDLSNVASRGAPGIGIRVDHQEGAEPAPIAGAKLWASYDEGRSWQQRPATRNGADAFTFRLDPRRDEPVSVKVEAWDTAGNRIEQTVVNAYRTAAPRPPAPSRATTVLASRAGDGSQANRGSSAPQAISADGRYVAFASTADNLVPGVPGFPGGVFVRDLRTGATTRVSQARDGGPAAGNDPVLSPDGRYVAFSSFDDTLVDGDTNEAADMFVHDRTTGRTERVSVAAGGAEADDGVSASPAAISADGRYVAFTSYSTNLVPGDTNGSADVFVRDRVTATTERVSVAGDGSQTPRFTSSSHPAISADGRYVTFQSGAPNLVAGDTNNTEDVFVRDRTAGTVTRVSVATDGAQGNRSSTDPAIDASGRYVAFASSATSLVAGDTNGSADVFVHDRTTGHTTRVSVGTGGTQSNGFSGGPAISADGRYVGFPSAATTLAGGDTNDVWDLFVHDRTRQQTERVSVAAAAGVEANQTTGFTPALSADGDLVAFVSSASNLVPADVNGESDVFVRHRARR